MVGGNQEQIVRPKPRERSGKPSVNLLKGGGVLMLTDVCFEDVEGIAGKTGFAVMHSEDMTARWQEYYIDAVWRGEECRHEQRGKCEYRMLICGKE